MKQKTNDVIMIVVFLMLSVYKSGYLFATVFKLNAG